jgi:hypothetical protein
VSLDEEFLSLSMFPDIIQPDGFALVDESAAKDAGCPLAISYPYLMQDEDDYAPIIFTSMVWVSESQDFIVPIGPDSDTNPGVQI